MIASDNTVRECSKNALDTAAFTTTDIVKENPGLSMLVVFAVGVGVGALLGEALPFPASQSRVETTAECIGRQICDALNIRV